MVEYPTTFSAPSLKCYADHGAGEIDVETVEEHADADQEHDAAVEWSDRKPIETAAGVDRRTHRRFPSVVVFVRCFQVF
jgi:hypothetical protein